MLHVKAIQICLLFTWKSDGNEKEVTSRKLYGVAAVVQVSQSFDICLPCWGRTVKGNSDL